MSISNNDHLKLLLINDYIEGKQDLSFEAGKNLAHKVLKQLKKVNNYSILICFITHTHNHNREELIKGIATTTANCPILGTTIGSDQDNNRINKVIIHFLVAVYPHSIQLLVEATNLQNITFLNSIDWQNIYKNKIDHNGRLPSLGLLFLVGNKLRSNQIDYNNFIQSIPENIKITEEITIPLLYKNNNPPQNANNVTENHHTPVEYFFYYQEKIYINDIILVTFLDSFLNDHLLVLENLLQNYYYHQELFISNYKQNQLLDHVDKAIDLLVDEIMKYEYMDALLKESQLAIDAVPELIFSIDKKYVYHLVNKSCTKYYDLPREQLIGESVPNIIGEEIFNQKIKALVDECFEKNKVMVSEFYREYPSIGKRSIRAHCYPFCDNANEISRVIVMIKDITEEKKLEKERLELESQLKQAHKMQAIGVLAGGVAHDFNNILASITISCDLLKESLKDNPEGLEDLKIVEMSAAKGIVLTKQLLGYARKGIYNKITLDINSNLDKCFTIINRTFNKNINIHLQKEEFIWPIIGDPEGINNVIMNMAINAQDSMPTGGDLFISSKNVYLNEEEIKKIDKNSSPGRYAVISIRDTGEGITSENLDKIFDPFFTTKKVGKGTGLGLSMAEGIIKSHQGIITVDSQIGMGTCFDLYFPVDKDIISGQRPTESNLIISTSGKDNTTQLATISDNSVDTKNSSHIIQEISSFNSNLTTNSSQKFLSNLSVLLVDDDKWPRTALENMLKRVNIKVFSTDNGPQAIKIYQEDPSIPLAILDYMMPNMNGIDLYHELKKINPNLRVLFSSGYLEDEKMTYICQEPYVKLLKKPYIKNDLFQAIYDLIHMP